MTVYIVRHGEDKEWNEGEVMRVFSTEEDAVDYADSVRNAWVEAWEVL